MFSRSIIASGFSCVTFASFVVFLLLFRVISKTVIIRACNSFLVDLVTIWFFLKGFIFILKGLSSVKNFRRVDVFFLLSSLLCYHKGISEGVGECILLFFNIFVLLLDLIIKTLHIGVI
jgi:hypothetical protein